VPDCVSPGSGIHMKKDTEKSRFYLIVFGIARIGDSCENLYKEESRLCLIVFGVARLEDSYDETIEIIILALSDCLWGRPAV
jgi:hypothetical protein